MKSNIKMICKTYATETEIISELFTISKNYQQTKYQNLKKLWTWKLKLNQKQQIVVITQYKHKPSQGPNQYKTRFIRTLICLSKRKT